MGRATFFKSALLFILAVVFLVPASSPGVETSGQVNRGIPYGKIRKDYLQVAYQNEKFLYDVSWTGGVKLGELHLEIRPVEGEVDAWEIYCLITTEGSIMSAIYPIHDIHITRVRGEKRLPYHFEVWQKEGYGYEAHRLTTYDQKKGVIRYQKNENPVVEYRIEGSAHNEFSAFFSSRLMDFQKGQAFLVPTFADKKQIDVEVRILDFTTLEETALGPVRVAEVTPILKFKGLYDKRGDTVIWYSDDSCRVPVLINSKIAIGSVTASLRSYENPLCPKYAGPNAETNPDKQ